MSHFASEWLWLASAAERVGREAGVATSVSTLTTDPWTGRFGSTPAH